MISARWTYDGGHSSHRYFPKYPDKPLRTTALLFGALVQHSLVSHITLGMFLRYVLEALRKPVGSKMCKFGAAALESFRERLPEWPQYCQHICAIPHFSQVLPDMVPYLEAVLAGRTPPPPPASHAAAAPANASPASKKGELPPASFPVTGFPVTGFPVTGFPGQGGAAAATTASDEPGAGTRLPDAAAAAPGLAPPPPAAAASLPAAGLPGGAEGGAASAAAAPPLPGGQGAAALLPKAEGKKEAKVDEAGKPIPAIPSVPSLPTLASAMSSNDLPSVTGAALGSVGGFSSTGAFGGDSIEPTAAAEVIAPPDAVQDRIGFCLNNMQVRRDRTLLMISASFT